MRCVVILWEPFDKPTLGRGLSLLADALYEKNTSKLSTAASLLELMCDQAYASKRSEPILRTISAFGFEACGESPRSKRSYLKLFDMTLPLEEALGSRELAKTFTQSIAYYGLRNLSGFKKLAELLFEELKKQQKHLGVRPSAFAKPDYLVSLGMIDLLLTYCEALERREKLNRLATKIESLNETARVADVSSWLAILTRLVCYALGSVSERSILNLHLPSHIESKLFNYGMTELWTPQAEAVEKGLLRGKNIVYSTGTATGKSLLAYLAAGSASINEKAIYIVPTRTLANEAFKTLLDLVHSSRTPVAISTREKFEFDDELSKYAVIISTYEKFTSLVKRKKINEADIRCLIADEVHFISNRERGIPLEFTLAKMKSKEEANDPQIVALSAMIGARDAKQLSSWLQASLIRTDWKPVDSDEMIFYKGKLYHKNGSIEEVRPPIRLLSSKEPKLRQRIAIAVRLVRHILVNGGQSMVIVRSRRDVEKVAEEISRYLDASRFFDPDSRVLLSLKKMEREKLRREIQHSEPELPLCAKKLVLLMNNGVAYHHAGLPARYREKIEYSVREQLVKVLITTTTFEVGVNLPISTVIFLDVSKGRKVMPVRTYKNLAGRAGRPEFDVKGESIIITLEEEEFANLRNLYFLSEEEPLESSIKYFMRRQPVARYAIQSQILETVLHRDTLDFQNLMDFMKQSWFWLRADEPTREKFMENIRIELWKLGIFGFIETSGDIIKITSSGKVAGKAMLSPFSIRNLIDNAQRIFAGNYDKESLVILLLSLVGIPHEVGDNDGILKRVKIPSKYEFVSTVLKQDATLIEPEERIQLCPQYATILSYWISSLPTEEILQLCGLNPSTDAALLEELLPNDAYWVLNTLASIPGSALKMTREQRDLIRKLAVDCKFGSSDPITHELLSLGLRYIGRNTAIKLAKHMHEKKKGIGQLTENDLLELFPKNQESAKLLFAELEEKNS